MSASAKCVAEERSMEPSGGGVFIVKKPRDDGVTDAAVELALWVSSLRPVWIEASTAKEFKERGFNSFKNFEPGSGVSLELCICIGGDGTLLHANLLFQAPVAPTIATVAVCSRIPPIVAFAMGTLGFLTPFALSDYKAVLTHLLVQDVGASRPSRNLEMSLVQRMRLCCKILRSASAGKSLAEAQNGLEKEKVEDEKGLASRNAVCVFEALNEVLIDRGPLPRISKLEMFTSGGLRTAVKADGLIIATPTGSTAYSLSAGGPMVPPSLSCFIVTPICPHSLSFRPLVLPSTTTISIRPSAPVCVSCDGRSRIDLQEDDIIEISIGRTVFPTWASSSMDSDWFNGLQNKLHWNCT